MTAPSRTAARALLLALSLSLLGCEKPEIAAAKAAEERVRLVEKSGSLDELCAAAEAARDAWLAALDHEQYQRWGLTASIHCRTADQQGGYLPADRGVRQQIQDGAEKISTDAPAESADNSLDQPDDL